MKITEKNINPKFETTESNLKKFDLTVTLSNQLVDSIVEMDAMPQKIYLYAIGHLDPKNPPFNNTVKVSKKALFALMSSSSSSSKHSRLKQVIEKLHQQSVIKIQRTKPNGKTEYKVISPLEITEFNDFSDAVSIKFSSSIMPLLTNLEDHFTQYTFDQVVNLTSKYAISFFQLFTKDFNLYEANRDNLTWSTKSLDRLKNPVFSIADLRKKFSIEKKYKAFRDFERRVIKEPIAQLNKYTDFKIDYELIKKGHTYTNIKFLLTRTMSVPVPYKQEQRDPAYLKGAEDKTEKMNQSYLKAMNSKYTKLLIKNFLISSADLCDLKLMSRLQNKVYPLYDRLSKDRGFESVVNHLSYVATHKEDYTIKNTVKYLEKSITSYLPYVNLYD